MLSQDGNYLAANRDLALTGMWTGNQARVAMDFIISLTKKGRKMSRALSKVNIDNDMALRVRPCCLGGSSEVVFRALKAVGPPRCFLARFLTQDRQPLQQIECFK